ncbi:MAG: 3'(2'),5'-bisphosphate nucleotidase CysQ [Mesorhizobium sp.]
MPDRDAELAEDLALIANAAREAGEIAMRYYGHQPEVWMKPGQSPVSEADIAVDLYLKDVLRSARPSYGWLSEETADTPERLETERVFIVDPIDGTRAFIDNRDMWCVSVAVVERGRPLVGVLACPAMGEFFTATTGGGATLDGRPLKISPRTVDPYIAGPKPLVDAARKQFAHMQTVPYIPSLAYRVAMVASGRIDATFIRPLSHDWDLAAADLILTEAGGGILERSGEIPLYGGVDPRHGSLVAGSPFLLDSLLELIAGLED